MESGLRLGFVKSGFKGQLPAFFSENDNSTWIVPDHFNDQNEPEPSRLVDESKCEYIVDLDLPHQIEPHYYLMSQKWDVLYEEDYLDVEHSPRWTRIFFIPVLSRKLNTYQPYTLLHRIPKPQVMDQVNQKPSEGVAASTA